MDLDLTWLTNRRTSLGDKAGPLDYVLNTIRDEQILRLEDKLLKSDSSLLIDFSNVQCAYAEKFETTHSILEQGLDLAEPKKFELIMINFQLAWLEFESVLSL